MSRSTNAATVLAARPNPRRPAAFTLIEMVTSLMILSVIVVACGSMVMMATRATGQTTARVNTQLQAADAATQIADDLNVAIGFTQRTATGVTFTVPDRLGLGVPQTVGYSWSGASGAPLLRQFNGGVATAILPAAAALKFDYLTRTLGPPPPPGEVVLAAHDASAGTLANYAMTNKNWSSQYFVPTLPLGTTSYTLTRVRLALKAGAQSDALVVSIRPPGTLNTPSSTVYTQTTVYQSALSTQYEWVDVPITGMTGLNPLAPLCIVMSSATGSTNIGAVQTDQALLNVLTGAFWSKSTNAGTSWSSGDSLTCARFYAYGTVP